MMKFYEITGRVKRVFTITKRDFAPLEMGRRCCERAGPLGFANPILDASDFANELGAPPQTRR